MAGRRSGGRPSWIAGVLLSWLARRAGDDRVRGFTASEESLKVLLPSSRMSPDGSTASEYSRSSWADKMLVASFFHVGARVSGGLT